MKQNFKMILATLLLMVTAAFTQAQCDQSVVLRSSTTIMMDSSDSVVRTITENSVIEFGKSEIIITPGEDKQVKGPISSHTCNWKVPFKEGKSVIKATVSNIDGQSRTVVVTIEGKDGVITFLATIDDDPNKRIKLTVDKFEPKK